MRRQPLALRDQIIMVYGGMRGYVAFGLAFILLNEQYVCTDDFNGQGEGQWVRCVADPAPHCSHYQPQVKWLPLSTTAISLSPPPLPLSCSASLCRSDSAAYAVLSQPTHCLLALHPQGTTMRPMLKLLKMQTSPRREPIGFEKLNEKLIDNTLTGGRPAKLF